MRIRKRRGPLPFSSISPVPLTSDPNFNRSPVVQLPLHQQHHHAPPPPCFDDPHFPSDDHPNHPIGLHLATQGRDSSSANSLGTTTIHGEERKKKQDNYSVLKQGGGELQPEEEEERGGGGGGGGEGGKSNDIRKKTVLGANLGTGSLLQSNSSSYRAVGSWVEGEKAFPLKKRRGRFERRGNDDDDDDDDNDNDNDNDDDDSIMEKDNNKKVMISRNKIIKTKMNKKFEQQRNDNDQPEEKEIKDSSSSAAFDDNNNNNNNPTGGKKRGRGGALMEGSRCSRVNGRGWRCCQQTLVGYSLCEHHLGKGRLRSMTSVRSRSLSGTNNAANEQQQQPISQHENQSTLSNYSSPSQQPKQTKREESENGDHEHHQQVQKPLMMTKKRVKLGMVKARSISSLLGQNDSAISVAAADNNNHNNVN